jgi:hypothetical protein
MSLSKHELVEALVGVILRQAQDDKGVRSGSSLSKHERVEALVEFAARACHAEPVEA